MIELTPDFWWFIGGCALSTATGLSLGLSIAKAMYVKRMRRWGDREQKTADSIIEFIAEIDAADIETRVNTVGRRKSYEDKRIMALNKLAFIQRLIFGVFKTQ